MKTIRSIGIAAFVAATALCHAQYSLAWAKQFNGTLNTVEYFTEMKLDKAGNSYVAGTTNVNSSASNADIVVLKYSPNGKLLWKQTFDGEAHDADHAFDLAVSDDGFVYVVGRTNSLTQSSNYITLKYQAGNGSLVWSRSFDGEASSIDQAMGVATDQLGNVFVTGEIWADHIPYSNGDYCTLKYTANGTLAWAKSYNGPNNTLGFHDQPQTIVVDRNGDPIVSGDSPDVSSISRIATIKYRSSDGAALWTLRSESISLSGTQIALAVAKNNDVVVGGTTQDFGLQVFMTRVNATTGAAVYTIRDAFPHGGRLKNRACMALDGSDNIGISVTYDPDNDNSNLNYNIQTSKYRFSDGFRLWSVSYGTTATLDGQSADCVTMDSVGNIFVGGSDLFAPNNVVSLWKFDSADGHLLWRANYNGPRQPDVTTRIRLDQHGDIIAAGITGVDVGSGDSDIQILKFSRKVPNLVSATTK